MKNLPSNKTNSFISDQERLPTVSAWTTNFIRAPFFRRRDVSPRGQDEAIVMEPEGIISTFTDVLRWSLSSPTSNQPTLSYPITSKINFNIILPYPPKWPPLWSSGQSFWLQIKRSRVRFPVLPDFLSVNYNVTWNPINKTIK
jgi:hypothetical protein